MLLLLLAAMLPLAPTLRNGFVYDDQLLLETDAPSAVGQPATSLIEVFTGDLFGKNASGEPASGYYRPLTRLTYWLEARIHGHRAWGYHLDNMLLSAAVVLLLFRLLRAIPALAPLAFSTALLFAVHPVHTESLALITGRTDPLVLGCVLLALSASLRGSARIASLLFAAALFCKESAVILLPAVAAIPFLGSLEAAARRRTALVTLSACLVLAAVFFLLKTLALGIVPPAEAWTGEGTLAQRLLTFLGLLPSYLGLLVWPAKLSIVHDVKLITAASDPRIWIGLALLLALFFLLRARSVPLRLGAGWLLLTLLPASNLVPISYTYRHIPFPFFERYLFVPSAGALLIVAVLLGLLSGRLRRGRNVLAAALLCLLAVPLGARTWFRCGEFESDTRLIAAAVEGAERPVPLLIHLAEARLRELDAWGALKTYERALAHEPGHEAAIVGRSTVLSILAQHMLESAEQHERTGLAEDAERIRQSARNMLEEARTSLESLVLARPGAAEALEALGTISAVSGRPREAATWYRRAYETGRFSPALPENFKRVALQLRQEAKARGDLGIKHARDAVRFYSLGILALAGGMPPGAIPDPVREITLRMLCERADNLFLLSHWQEAREAYLEILELEPTLYRCHEGLGGVAKQLGDRREAYQQFERALRIYPDAFMALNEMMTMCQEDGRTEEAGEYFRRLERVLAESARKSGAAKPADQR
ncbi:MAG: tetratricopeptide repeat protein [Planctomycetota bacterium]